MKNVVMPLCLLATMSSMVAVTGCTPSAREDVSQAGSNIGSATTKSVDATGKVIGDAGTAVKDGAVAAGTAVKDTTVAAGKQVKEGADKAVQGTEKAVVNAGVAVKDGAVAAGTAVKDTTNAAVMGTEKAVAKTGAAMKESTAVVSLTPSVKAAILKDDSVKISDLNIDTVADTKQVIVKGTAASDAMKTKAMADAKTAMAGDTSGYKLVDQLKVAK